MVNQLQTGKYCLILIDFHSFEWILFLININNLYRYLSRSDFSPHEYHTGQN